LRKEPEMLEKLLVAIDESEHTPMTLAGAMELATKAGSEVRIVHVVEMAFTTKEGQLPLEDREDAERLLNDAVSSFAAAGVKVSGVLRAAQTTRVASEVLAEASQCGATLMVAGASGHALEGLLVGSTITKLMHLGKLPLVIVR